MIGSKKTSISDSAGKGKKGQEKEGYHPRRTRASRECYGEERKHAKKKDRNGGGRFASTYCSVTSKGRMIEIKAAHGRATHKDRLEVCAGNDAEGGGPAASAGLRSTTTEARRRGGGRMRKTLTLPASKVRSGKTCPTEKDLKDRKRGGVALLPLAARKKGQEQSGQ